MLLKSISLSLSDHIAIQVIGSGWTILYWIKISKRGRGDRNNNVLVYLFAIKLVGGIYSGLESRYSRAQVCVQGMGKGGLNF